MNSKCCVAIPKLAMLLNVVMAMDKSKLPSNKTVQMFEAPPAGDAPVKNIPNCISTLFGNSNMPKPKLN